MVYASTLHNAVRYLERKKSLMIYLPYLLLYSTLLSSKYINVLVWFMRTCTIYSFTSSPVLTVLSSTLLLSLQSRHAVLVLALYPVKKPTLKHFSIHKPLFVEGHSYPTGSSPFGLVNSYLPSTAQLQQHFLRQVFPYSCNLMLSYYTNTQIIYWLLLITP